LVWTHKIGRGHSLRIINEYATSGVSVFLWNAHDTSERYNAPDSVKVQWTARLGLGKLMLSDMGRVLASITADTCGLHDSIAGGSTPQSNLRNYGTAGLRNTRDNFLLAAGKHGFGPARSRLLHHVLCAGFGRFRGPLCLAGTER
jgi:uncharacterized protein YcgI (DUF1989 family)